MAHADPDRQHRQEDCQKHLRKPGRRFSVAKGSRAAFPLSLLFFIVFLQTLIFHSETPSLVSAAVRGPDPERQHRRHRAGVPKHLTVFWPLARPQLFLAKGSSAASPLSVFSQTLKPQTFCPQLSVAQILSASIARTEQVCRDTYGTQPQFLVTGDTDTIFSYIPPHLDYMFFEILKVRALDNRGGSTLSLSSCTFSDRFLPAC